MDAHGRVEPDSGDEPLSCSPAQGWPESREGEAVPPSGQNSRHSFWFILYGREGGLRNAIHPIHGQW